MMNLASKTRPFFGAIVLTAVLLTAGGIYSYTLMPSGIYPEVSFPRIAVVARVPGLGVANTQVLVTRPLEEAVSTVPGVAQVRSKTIRGSAELSIDFTPNTDMLRAEQLTWNRIGAVRGQLPKDSELTVDRMTPSIFPIMSIVLTGGKNSMQLYDYAFYQLKPKIKNTPGVLYANVAGGDIREIVVEPRPEDLIAAGLSAADLADQIAKVHILEPVGRIEKQPLAWQILVDSYGETTRKLDELVLSTSGKQTLRVGDVADVKVWHQDRTLSVGFAGRDAVVISVFRNPGGNTVAISDQVRELLAKEPLPSNMQATVVYDQATFVTTAVHNVRDAIIIGGIFSVLILLLFLRSWRATLVSAIAIPTTLAITFLILNALGATLNLMSLGGLAVAIGLIIDDTVVVIENIARHLTPGEHGTQSAAGVAYDPVDAASGEITGAVVGSSLTTVLVFVPLVFISGVYGSFFGSLTLALATAVLVSMVISLTLIPVFAAKFLAGKPMAPPGRMYNMLANGYEWALSVALRFPKVCLTFSLAAVAVGYVLVAGIPNYFAVQEPGKPPPAPLLRGLETGLMPEMDEGAFVLDYWAPSGTPLERTQLLAREVEHVLSDNPDVEAYVRRSGAELGIYATQSNRGDIQVVLRPASENPFTLMSQPIRPPFDEVKDELEKLGREQAEHKYGPKFTPAQMWAEGKAAIQHKYRRRSAPEVMIEVEDEIKQRFSEHQLKIDTAQIMQDELNDLSGANKPVEVQLFGPDYQELRALASKVGDVMEKKGAGKGLRDVNSTVRQGNPDLLIQPDSVRSRRLGLTADEIRRQIGAMYQGQVATQVRETAVRITDVRVRYPNRLRYGLHQFDPEDLLNQWLLLPEQAASPTAPAPSGPARTVPLYAVANVQRVRSPDEVWRQNSQPAIFVTAALNEKEAGLGTVVGDVRRWMADIPLATGYRWEMGGHYLRQQQAFQSLLIVMIVAIFLVYVMLAFQFRSVLLPMAIFLTEPLSLVSGLFALWITHTPLNVSSYMGAVLLIGLDMKNGILIVEYVQQLRKEGMQLRPALLLAGRTRFRPILMTSLAAILGLFPLALGIGPGAQMQQPLAIMVIGGLTANMLFTRMIIPVGYFMLERFGH